MQGSTALPPSASIGPAGAALAPLRMGELAETYAALGWNVFPLHRITSDGRCGCGQPLCTDGGKHPAIRWREGSTNDAAEVRRYWSRWPFSGIGLDTGKSGLYVVDIDPKNGGAATLAELETAHGDWHNCLTANTGGGGLHFYYHNLKTAPLHNGTLGVGIDTRGDGGYVVLPPSIHRSGVRYSWAEEFEVERIGHLPQFVTQRQAVKPVWTPNGRIPEGARNSTLASLAGKLRWIGLSEVAIAAALQVTAQEQCDSPETISPKEITGMAHFAASKPTNDGKQALRRAEWDALARRSAARAENASTLVSRAFSTPRPPEPV